MSSATTILRRPPFTFFPDPPRPLPTLEQLYEMTSVPEERVVIHDVDWAFYEQLVDSIPPGAGIHVDYDGKDIEIMSLSGLHDCLKVGLGRFVELVAEELEIPCRGLGQTTWKRGQIARGLEADECYCFAPDKLTMIAEAIARISEVWPTIPIPTWPSRSTSRPRRSTGRHLCRPGCHRGLATTVNGGVS